MTTEHRAHFLLKAAIHDRTFGRLCYLDAKLSRLVNQYYFAIIYSLSIINFIIMYYLALSRLCNQHYISGSISRREFITRLYYNAMILIA